MTTFVGTSWKMNKTTSEARAFADHLRRYGRWGPNVQPFVIPAFTAIATTRDALGPDSAVWVGAQNAHWAANGPYTGEVSMAMVRDAGANLVELGHSERRELFNESDATVALKVRAALSADLVPLVCVGESRDVRLGGGAVAHLVDQLRVALSRVPEDLWNRVLVAYEPIWSIGEVGHAASVDVVAEAAEAIRARFPLLGLLYGGSITTANAADYLAVAELDGLFIGRSAWDPSGFTELLAIASTAGVSGAGASG